jgi:archaeosortase A (PGF-CTERM-specific)
MAMMAGTNILWISLLLLMISAITGRKVVAGAGWIAFGVYWLTKPAYFLGQSDFFNAALVIGAAAFSFYLAWHILSAGRQSDAIRWASCAAAISGLIYFPFIELPLLGNMLIGATASLTYALLEVFGIPAIMQGWNLISLNGRMVEIVLACTAIESIALFAGVILSVRASGSRRAAAFLISVTAIYLLNLLRNAFVLMAYGEGWFGESSFYVAHNVIAKVGSTIALLFIAYAVFTLLPELLSQIDALAAEIRRPGGPA